MYFSPLAATTPQTTPWHKGSPSHLCCDALVQCVITTPVLIGVALRFSLTLHLHLCRWILSTLCSESQVSPFSEMSRSSLLILSCACPRTSCRGSTCSLNSSASPPTPIISAHTHTYTQTDWAASHGLMLGAERGPPHILAEVYRHRLEAGFSLRSLRTNRVWLDSSEPVFLSLNPQPLIILSSHLCWFHFKRIVRERDVLKCC